jgi:diguanylate cyclase (GGDEF)-like protein
MEAAGLIAGVTDIDSWYDAVNKAAVEILRMDDFRFIMIDGVDVKVLAGDDLPPDFVTRKLVEAAENQGRTRISESFAAWSLGETAEGRAVGLFHCLPGYSDEIRPIMMVLIPIIFRAWEQVARLEQLRRYATTDPLTKVWNRRAFLQQSGLSLRRCIGKRTAATVVIYDIDHFKHVNDVYGHPYGDRILVKTAEAMNNSLRSNDLMCRWGGEEFVLYLDGVGGEEAFRIAERIRRTAGEATLGEKISVTLSAGIRVIDPDEPEILEKALRKADKGLLSAKASGRNRICLFED